LLRELKDNGLVRLEVSYSGGGDDGCIDTFSGYEINEKGEEKWSPDSVPQKFQDEFDDYLYDFISNNIEWDWINNDGGYGVVTIDLETGKMTIDHSQRHIEEYYYDNIESELEKSLNGSS
jgi:hypothetical protein